MLSFRQQYKLYPIFGALHLLNTILVCFLFAIFAQPNKYTFLRWISSNLLIWWCATYMFSVTHAVFGQPWKKYQSMFLNRVFCVCINKHKRVNMIKEKRHVHKTHSRPIVHKMHISAKSHNKFCNNRPQNSDEKRKRLDLFACVSCRSCVCLGSSLQKIESESDEKRGINGRHFVCRNRRAGLKLVHVWLCGIEWYDVLHNKLKILKRQGVRKFKSHKHTHWTVYICIE